MICFPRSRLRRGLAGAGAALCAAAVLGGWSTAHAQTNSPFSSYTIAATAPGFEMTEDEPSANAHPEGGGTAPYSTSALDGGDAYGLASVAWPGQTEANADKLVLLIFPKAIQRGCTPSPDNCLVPPIYQPVPDAVRQLVGTAAPLTSYPLRAEASTKTRTTDAKLDAQGATLSAHADPALAQAVATTKSTDGQTFTFGNATTQTAATVSGNTGQATAHSNVGDISIGGVIAIKSVISDATASTDAINAKSSGSTTVEGMTIAGQPAYVDDTGVHFGSQSQPANAAVAAIANQALSGGGFQFFVAQPQQEVDGATASYTAGSLVILWTPPQSSNLFLISLGGARVSVTATPGLAGYVPPPPATTSPTTTAPRAVAAPRPSGITSTRPTTSPPTTQPNSSETLFSVPIAATFKGLGAWVVVGLMGASMIGAGTWRVADDIVFRPPSTCPEETT